MFEVNYRGKRACQLSSKFCVVHEAINGTEATNSKYSLKACFENVKYNMITKRLHIVLPLEIRGKL